MTGVQTCALPISDRAAILPGRADRAAILPGRADRAAILPGRADRAANLGPNGELCT